MRSGVQSEHVPGWICFAPSVQTLTDWSPAGSVRYFQSVFSPWRHFPADPKSMTVARKYFHENFPSRTVRAPLIGATHGRLQWWQTVFWLLVLSSGFNFPEIRSVFYLCTLLFVTLCCVGSMGVKLEPFVNKLSWWEASIRRLNPEPWIIFISGCQSCFFFSKWGIFQKTHKIFTHCCFAVYSLLLTWEINANEAATPFKVVFTSNLDTSI